MDRLEPGVRLPWIEECLREGPTGAALSPIVWVYSMTRTAAPCTLAITKSVSVRPCSSARWNSAFWSRETRASSRSSRTLAVVFPDMPHYTLSCIRNLASIYG